MNNMFYISFFKSKEYVCDIFYTFEVRDETHKKWLKNVVIKEIEGKSKEEQ